MTGFENLNYIPVIFCFDFEDIGDRPMENVPMGNPLGPKLADVFLSMMDTKFNDRT